MNYIESPSPILEWAPENDNLSFVVDLRDLGLKETYYAWEVHRGSNCPIYQMAGPEIWNPHIGKMETPAWIL